WVQYHPAGCTPAAAWPAVVRRWPGGAAGAEESGWESAAPCRSQERAAARRCADGRYAPGQRYRPAGPSAGTAPAAGYWRISPSPSTTYFCDVSPSRPTGPRAWILSVEIPISAPRPYSKPSAKRVEALIITELESTSVRKRRARL